MPTTTKRTPAEWAQFCAEKVMGWTQNPSVEYLWTDSAGGIYHINSGDDEQDWSPYENIADALAVLERLQLKLQTPNGNMPDTYLRQFWSDEGQVWGVQIGDEGERVCVSGDHFGPAVCRLAEKILNG